jgi:hypothetical protein
MMLTVSAPVIGRPLAGCCGHAKACTGFERAGW